jgi:hypothetical protein
MAGPDTLIVDGRAFSWQCLCVASAESLACRLSQVQQPTLFAVLEPNR